MQQQFSAAASDESRATTLDLDFAGFYGQLDAEDVSSPQHQQQHERRRRHHYQQQQQQRQQREKEHLLAALPDATATVEQSWESAMDHIFGSAEQQQTVCWLDQKPDEVDSFLISAASPDHALGEPLESITEVDTKPLDLSAPPPPQQLAQGSEAFLQSAIANTEDAGDNESTVIDLCESAEDTKAATVLRDLQTAVAKLSTDTRLCICNALYRLAGNAAAAGREPLSDSDKDSSKRGDSGETTHSLDRKVANLLFHRQETAGIPSSPPRETAPAAAAAEPPALHASVRAVNKCNPSSKLPAVVTNKQPEFPSSSGTAKLTTTTTTFKVHSNGRMPWKLPKEFSIQAKKLSGNQLIGNSRKRVKLQ